MTKILGALGVALTLYSSPGHAQDAVPVCDDPHAVEGVKHSFNESQGARRRDLALVDLTNIEEYGDYRRSGVRQCSAIAGLNNSGRTIIDYIMKLDRKGTGTEISLRWYNIDPGPWGQFGFQ